MQPKARMTIRFDPPKQAPGREREKEPLLRPQERQREPAMADHSESRSGGGYSGGPLHDDPHALEQMIRGADALPGTSRFAEPGPGSAQADGADGPSPASREEPEPEAIDITEHAGRWNGHLTRREGPSWWKVFASVAGAIATGALFGYLVLTLFTGQTPFPSGPASNGEAPAQASAGASPAGPPASSGQPAAAASGDAAELAPHTYYLLQYGVFRTEESMNAALDELKGRGLPGTADTAEGFRVFVGAAPTKEEAERLAGQLSGLEVFVKAAETGPARLTGGEAAAQAAAFLAETHELAGRLSSLSIASLQDAEPQPIDAQTLAGLREAHMRWRETAGAADRLQGDAGEAARRIVQDLDSAMVSVEDYGRKISRFHLWSVQSDIMDVLLADRELRTALQSVPTS